LSTIVAADGRYVGAGSKQTTLSGSGIVIVKVTPNVPSGDYHKTAIIENLIIDGKNPATNGISAGSVGILLQNVYNCVIRNVTILNCEVGIKIENTNNYWSQSNRIEHVRMTNVKTGILFTAAGTNGDFGFTTIKDVGIKLSETEQSNVGIQIGTANGPVVKPYSSFIKATVWLGKTGANYGMRIYGELKYSLVMFAVECPDASGGLANKVGVDIQTDPVAVSDNQSFMLSLGANIPTAVLVPPQYVPPFIHHDIVTEII